MSTPNIPDDELDDFFKKSLGDPELDFREEDWLKMEQKLRDNRAREKATYRRFLYSLLGLLLVIAPVLTWYFITPSSPASLPAVAVRENENTSGTENGNIPASASENAPGSTKQPTPEQSVAEKAGIEKADENKPEIISSPGNKPDPAPTQDVSKLQNAPRQSRSVNKNGLKKADLPSRQPLSSANKEDEYEKKTSSGRTPSTPDLLSGNTIPKNTHADTGNNDTEKEVNNKGKDEQLITQVPQNIPVEKQPSGLVANDTDREKQLPVYTQQKKGDHPVSGPSETDKNIQEQSLNHTNGAPIVILPSQNRQETDAIYKESGLSPEISTPDQDRSAAQPNKISTIKAISGLAVRPLMYETQFTTLLTLPAGPSAKPAQTDSTRRKKLAVERVQSRVSMNVLLSPDLSSIGFSDLRPPGTNLGISLEYHISNKISVLVGAIYSTKIYEANANKYNPDNPYWASYYPKPVDVKGNCKVIDLPVNIRYNILGREKYNLYVSGGTSSYLMLKEDYKYIYNVDDTDLRKGWHGKNENKHFFKVINLSAGYERKLNRRISLQAEPFIKLPTAGVGYGRIKLLSTGLFVSMKYNF